MLEARQVDLQRELDRLRVELEELRVSRRRLVLAADADRRTIERDLHDGIHQHLIALAVSLQLARQAEGSDPLAVPALLAEMGRAVQDALEETAQLSQRIYPASLEAVDLAAVLRSASAAAGVSATIDVSAAVSYPPGAVMTIHLCWLDTLARAGDGARDDDRRARPGRRPDVPDHRGRDRVGSGSRPPPGASRGPRRARHDHVAAPRRDRRGVLAPDGSMTLAAVREVEDDGLDALVDRRFPGQAELQEDRVDHLLDRPLGQDERRRSPRCSSPLPSRAARRAHAGSDSLSGESSSRAFSATSASTTFGSKTEPPSATAWIAATSWSRSFTRSFSR